MAYTTKNFKTKKELVALVAAGGKVTCYNPGLGPNLENHTGTVYLEGPHYPKPHTWYATATLVGGIITKVK
jgi:hypothetical protein